MVYERVAKEVSMAKLETTLRENFDGLLSRIEDGYRGAAFPQLLRTSATLLIVKAGTTSAYLSGTVSGEKTVPA